MRDSTFPFPGVRPLSKLLEEKPSVKGISLPGMPQGSPGMSGRKEGPFVIHTIGKEKQVFWRE